MLSTTTAPQVHDNQQIMGFGDGSANGAGMQQIEKHRGMPDLTWSLWSLWPTSSMVRACSRLRSTAACPISRGHYGHYGQHHYDST